MKLLFCPHCHDAHELIMDEWRKCLCGKSGGQYNRDGMTATLGGDARVFGVGNPFFDPMYQYLEDEGKRRLWQDMYGHQMGDCWWGEYSGDQQIFRIPEANGPRLRVKIISLGNQNEVIVLSKFIFHGMWRDPNFSVTVPANPQVKIKKAKTNEKRRDKQAPSSEVPEGVSEVEVVGNKDR